MLEANCHLKSYPLPSPKSHKIKTEVLLLSVVEFYLEQYRLYFLPQFKQVNYDLEAKLIHPQYP